MGDFASRLIEGLLAPRASARRLLDGGHDWDAIVALALLGYLITAIFATFFGIGPQDVSIVARQLSGLLNHAIVLALVTFLAWKLGGVAGGTATFKSMLLAISWQQVVTAFLSPFMFMMMQSLGGSLVAVQQQAEAGVEPTMPEIGGGVLLIGIAAGIYSVWLLASYIAEAHGFASTLRVMGVVLGIPLVLAALLVGVLGGA